MKSRTSIVLWVLLCGIPAFPDGRALALAEGETIAHVDVFGELQRPPVPFDHDAHMDALDDDCGACHHVFNGDSGSLVPADGDEKGCAECHGAGRDGRVPALREAYHGQCTACHRAGNRPAPAGRPVTCGGCHPRR